MLQRLGRRLTLLNLVISGAILTVMALVALGVAGETITGQYENDLTMYSRSINTVMARASEAGASFYLQTPARYMVYMRDLQGVEHVMTEASSLMPTAERVAMQAQQAIETWSLMTEPLFSGFSAVARPAQVLTGYDAPDITLSSGVAAVPFRPRIAKVNVVPAHVTLSMRTMAQPLMLTDAEDGTRYRVTATAVGSAEDEAMIIVMQNRADELDALSRMRWLFIGCIIGGLVLSLGASLLYSARAIRPIDASIRQQRAFVAAASHELRTPVAALRANAEVLADAPLGDYAPYLDAIRGVSERMGVLISDMMELARADAGELTCARRPVDAHEVASRAVQWMRPLAEAGGIRLLESLGPVVLLGDPDRLRQMLLALLDNAIRYTKAGEVVLTTARVGKHAVITVEDTGIGIPDADKPRVFDRFYRVDTARARADGGAGLGLSIVRQLAERMDGEVTLRDRPGGGSVFILKFHAVE